MPGLLRALASACLLAAALAPAGAAGAADGARPAVASCLSQAEIREEVGAKRVVPQVAALRAARASLGGEAVRARLCRQADGSLVYAITSLRRDGKVVRVYVDAQSGKVLTSR